MPQLKPTRGTIRYTEGHPLGPAGGLVGHLLFSEGTGEIVQDSSGSRKTGIISGDFSWTTGKFGSVGLFGGTDSKIDCGAIEDSTTAITIVFWLYWSGTNGEAIMGDDGYYINSFGNYIRFRPYGLTSTALNGTAGTVPDNIWLHCACVWDGAFTYIYINGVLDVSQAATGSLTTGATAFTLGYDAHLDNRFTGMLDCVSVYRNVALSAFDIARLCSKPFCMVEPGITPARFYSIPPAVARVRSRPGFKPITGADRLRGLRRYALY